MDIQFVRLCYSCLLQSGDYSPEHDDSINPLSLDIDWKVEEPILSEKDSHI